LNPHLHEIGTEPMERFFKSDIFWLTVPFLTDEQRVPWISRRAEIQSDAPDGTVVILNHCKIVYVHQTSHEMAVEAREADLVFDFTRSLPARHKQTTPYCSVNYPGKNRLHWIYPLNNKKPAFLHFYYLDSRCSQVAAFMFCVLFYIKRWLRKHTFTLHTTQQPLPEQTRKAMNASGYCIRLGIRGTNRSIVIAYSRGTRSIAFGKYATSYDGLGNLSHERQALQEVRPAGDFEIPALLTAENSLTPWNLYRGKNHYHIFDWELYTRKRPLLFYFFHYILQRNIYSGKGSSEEMRREFRGLKTHPDVLDLLTAHETSWEQCLHQFLVVQAPYFLKQYALVSAGTPPYRAKRNVCKYSENL
jgi:hypothetical protein